jgi:putative ABC transport system permease protein
VLMTCGGLLARSFFLLYNTSPVIDTRDVVAMQLTLPETKYARPDQRRQFASLLDDRLTTNRVFAEATIASDVPLQPLAAASRLVVVDGAVPPPGETPPRATYITAGPRFFSTLRFPVVRGRALTEDDGRPGSEGVVINQQAATRLFGDADPIGLRIRLAIPGAAAGTPDRAATVVGVVPTVPDFLPLPDAMVVYAPLLTESTPGRTLSVMVRSISKAAAAEALREQVRALDADLPVHQIMTLEEVLALTRTGARMVGSWFQTLAVIAMALACVGLFALTAHGVAQRTHEIGVRMAIGARAAQVMWLFVRQTLWLLATGIGIGIAVALSFTRLLTTFLGGVDPRDPVTFLVVTLMLVSVAIAAALMPSLRAARIDPVAALRGD